MSIFSFAKWHRENKEEPGGEVELEISVRIVIEEDEGKFCAAAPALPGLIIDGDTVEQTKHRARDGINVHLMAMTRNGDPLPVGPDLTVGFHDKPEYGFPHFGNPKPYPDPSHWTIMRWPIRELLGAN